MLWLRFAPHRLSWMGKLVFFLLFVSTGAQAQLVPPNQTGTGPENGYLVSAQFLAHDFRDQENEPIQNGIALNFSIATPRFEFFDNMPEVLAPRLQIGGLISDGDTSAVGYIDVTAEQSFFHTSPVQPYIAGAFGFAVHNGTTMRSTAPAPKPYDNYAAGKRPMGSVLQFHEQIEAGLKIDKARISATWSHISHANVFHDEFNAGMTWVGLKVGYEF